MGSNKVKSRMLFFISAILIGGILAACGSSELSEQSLDFSDSSQALVAQKFEGGREEQKPGGIEKGGLEMTKVSGHKWLLIYDHPKQTALLKVGIVSWDEERYSLTDIHYNCEYEYDNATVSGDRVTLELDQTTTGIAGGLRAAVQDCYSRASIQPENGSVPGVENYPAVQFETVGKWTQADRGQMVRHPSFDYFFEINSGSDVIIVLEADGGSLSGSGQTNNRSIASKSRAFRVPNRVSDPFHSATNFEFWQSVYDSPEGRMTYVEHYLWNPSGEVYNFTAKQEQKAAALRIILDPVDLVIEPPAGFDLDKFIVDPKNFGSGGG